MSTVDKQTAEDVITGEYPEDEWYSIIAYIPPFPNAETAFKLCKDKGKEFEFILSFTSRNISCSVVWRAQGENSTIEKFEQTLNSFLASPFLKRW